MNIEYEATFLDINKDKIRQKLKGMGAELIKPEFMQKRVVFNLPDDHHIKGGWMRVREEGDKITLSLKSVIAGDIKNQKEICLEIDNFNNAVKFLEWLGYRNKAYQESKREFWIFDDVEVTIDEWPFLEPFVEVEGRSEEEVKKVSEKLGFNWQEAKFCSIDYLYSWKYDLSLDKINNHTPKIVFNMENPFIFQK